MLLAQEKVFRVFLSGYEISKTKKTQNMTEFIAQKCITYAADPESCRAAPTVGPSSLVALSHGVAGSVLCPTGGARVISEPGCKHVG